MNPVKEDPGLLGIRSWRWRDNLGASSGGRGARCEVPAPMVGACVPYRNRAQWWRLPTDAYPLRPPRPPDGLRQLCPLDAACGEHGGWAGRKEGGPGLPLLSPWIAHLSPVQAKRGWLPVEGTLGMLALFLWNLAASPQTHGCLACSRAEVWGGLLRTSVACVVALRPKLGSRVRGCMVHTHTHTHTLTVFLSAAFSQMSSKTWPKTAKGYISRSQR